MFELFTDEARRAMGLSRREAQGLGTTYIGSEHILLALADEKCPSSHRLLAESGITHDEALKVVAAYEADPEMKGAPGQLPFTDNAKRALEYSMEASGALGHDSIATEHVLLGLLRVEDSKGVRVIRDLQGRPEALRSACYRSLGAEVPEGE
jgi:ATP-dependent Clp protease ATP-binding subunit ClpA